MVGEVRSARGVDTIPLETIYMENRDLFIMIIMVRRSRQSGVA